MVQLQTKACSNSHIVYNVCKKLKCRDENKGFLNKVVATVPAMFDPSCACAMLSDGVGLRVACAHPTSL